MLDFTSRKHVKKEPQSFSHCGSFDHPDPQVNKRLQICLFGLPTENLRILGLLIYRYIGHEITFSTVYYMPPEFQNCSRKTYK
jgi:hypothetical protein